MDPIIVKPSDAKEAPINKGELKNKPIPSLPPNPVPVKEAKTFPTEIVELPSKGLLYPKDHPFSIGSVEIKYMTAKEEDILSTKSYMQKGIVLDKLLQSLIVPDVDYGTILLGDKNAIMIAARRYGYGDEYETTVTRENGDTNNITVDLSKIGYTEIDETKITSGKNEFEFTTPIGKDSITFSLLTIGRFNDLEKALKGYQKIKNGMDKQMTTRLRYMITSVNGSAEAGVIKKYVDNMLSRDSRAFRSYIGEIQPDLDLNMELEDEFADPFRGKISIGIDLFYPDFKSTK